MHLQDMPITKTRFKEHENLEREVLEMYSK
jgi:hypothetical protein